MLEFLLCVINDVEALPKISQGERLLAVFLYNKLKKIFSIMKRFVDWVIRWKYNPRKLMAIDLNNKQFFLPATSANVIFGERKIINKWSTVQATDYWTFYQNFCKFLLHFVNKLYT